MLGVLMAFLWQGSASPAAHNHRSPEPQHQPRTNKLAFVGTDTSHFKMHATSTLVSILSLAAAATAFPRIRRTGTAANGTNVVSGQWDG